MLKESASYRKEIARYTEKNGIVQPPPIIRQNALTIFLKRCWVLIACLIIAAAIISSFFRALTPFAKQYKAEVEQHLSTVFGEKVSIKTMETGWYWFEPVVKLNQISISDGKERGVKLANLLIGIDILSSLWHWQIQPGILLIEDLHLGLHQENGSWQVDGIDGLDNHKLNWDLATLEPIFAWILGQQKIIIRNLSADVYMQDGTLIPLSKLKLKIANHAGHYYVKGKGSLLQNTATNFQLLADLVLDPYALNKTKGHVFFSVLHLLPAQWQGFAPHFRYQAEDGQGNLQLWIDLAKGQPQNVQASLRLHHLIWLDKQTQKKQLVKTFKANLAWKPTEDGWLLTGDQVHLGLGDTRWPENSFMLRYKKESQDYFVFVKNILLEPLVASSLTWPEALKPIIANKPHGHFRDTQIQFKSSSLNYILTRFSDFGWQEHYGPGFDNLSGAFYWQPKEGRLELAGEKILINQKKQKPITISDLKAAFDWQEASDGLRVNIERLVLNHPNLSLDIKGKVDKIATNSSGQVNLKAVFSGKNIDMLLPYLPEKQLKPKLEAWLKRDVKRIGELNGDLIINGSIADFPYDKQAGEFEINTQVKGVDLFFSRDWPLVKNMAMSLRVNKRDLAADIVYANLAEMTSYKSSIRINDMGLGREILDLRTHFDLKAGKALSALMATPLNKKLSALSILEMKGLLGLDLQLEAPLYPEDDNILAFGNLSFHNNQLKVHHSMDDIELNNLTGWLQFNQSGIIDSKLSAQLFNSPANLVITSILKPIPSTQVKIETLATAEMLNKKLKLPISSILHGSAWMQSTFQLTDDPNDLDHLHLQTALDGLSIDLPPPLGKTAEAKTPLTLDIDFNPQKALRMRLNYENRLSSNLWFSRSKGALKFKKGEIRIGSGLAKKQNREGLKVIGSLASFDLQNWLDAQAKLPTIQDKSMLSTALNSIDLEFSIAKIWKENYKDLALKAIKLDEDDWSIQLKHERLAGTLRYQLGSNTLSGEFDRIHLENKLADNKTALMKPSTLKPSDIPNLDLRIASFQLGATDLGDISLKTKSSSKLWQLDYCKIKSPSYLLNVKGEWKQESEVNVTNFQADMKIVDLAKSLEQWKINPGVEAKRGDVQFQGGWDGSLPDFQLAKLNGQMKIDLINGRITNLSPETEEKIGLGKLLSILSLQTLPRRLKLDFSDLSKTGYSFDKFQGNFDISNGIMNTQDSHIDGPVAYASIKGNLDIAKQYFDVDLKVSPHITASLPVVATIAGGPIAGLATWVVSKIINQEMHKVSGYSYKITGPWKQPVVQQVTIIKKQRVPLR
ncbi:MAG: TIGR02099 family protein [Tatlockia sp.]|nr:TIGR02099 family protein [Tatlockia sp.]